MKWTVEQDLLKIVMNEDDFAEMPLAIASMAVGHKRDKILIVARFRAPPQYSLSSARELATLYTQMLKGFMVAIASEEVILHPHMGVFANAMFSTLGAFIRVFPTEQQARNWLMAQ
jgi:hypothetical protein